MEADEVEVDLEIAVVEVVEARREAEVGSAIEAGEVDFQEEDQEEDLVIVVGVADSEIEVDVAGSRGEAAVAAIEVDEVGLVVVVVVHIELDSSLMKDLEMALRKHRDCENGANVWAQLCSITSTTIDLYSQSHAFSPSIIIGLTATL